MEQKNVYSIATDPIYIGTGGYTIGRVDNTIVRDAVTRIPKIPGTSIAGTWRYFTALKLLSYFKNPYRRNLASRKEIGQEQFLQMFSDNNLPEWVKQISGNYTASLQCAGQDEAPHIDWTTDAEQVKGHCGNCIVCRIFGYSKKNRSKQGQAFFSDMHILFFPVYTRYGVRWITSPSILFDAGLVDAGIYKESGSPIRWDQAAVLELKQSEAKQQKDMYQGDGHINLGWLNLEMAKDAETRFKFCVNDSLKKLIAKYKISGRIIIVSDDLIAQIINSNLEVRTSVSIDPLTGAAKEGALFTSEAIPRGTVFYGNVRVFDDLEDCSSGSLIFEALSESKIYYETLGVGGMVTRGFGRMKVYLKEEGGPDNDSKSGFDSEPAQL